MNARAREIAVNSSIVFFLLQDAANAADDLRKVRTMATECHARGAGKDIEADCWVFHDLSYKPRWRRWMGAKIKKHFGVALHRLEGLGQFGKHLGGGGFLISRFQSGNVSVIDLRPPP